MSEFTKNNPELRSLVRREYKPKIMQPAMTTESVGLKNEKLQFAFDDLVKLSKCLDIVSTNYTGDSFEKAQALIERAQEFRIKIDSLYDRIKGVFTSYQRPEELNKINDPEQFVTKDLMFDYGFLYEEIQTLLNQDIIVANSDFIEKVIEPRSEEAQNESQRSFVEKLKNQLLRDKFPIHKSIDDNKLFLGLNNSMPEEDLTNLEKRSRADIMVIQNANNNSLELTLSLHGRISTFIIYRAFTDFVKEKQESRDENVE